MKEHIITWITGCCILLSPLLGMGQEKDSIVDSLNAEDQDAVYALVLYPEDIRIAILEVCKSPEIILHLDDIRNQTQQRFNDLMASEPRDRQEQWYQLSRYPELIEALSDNSFKEREIRDLLSEYSEEIEKIGFDLWKNDQEKIQEIYNINSLFSENVSAMLRPYPELISSSVYQLIDLPEVLDILKEHFTISVKAGAMYRQNPQRLMVIADSLHLVAAQRNAEELEKWEQELKENPEARKQLEAAAQEFYDEYEADPPVYRNPDEEEEIHIHYHVDPYPYWIGYPSWYRYPYWYPRPYWYHLGFYWRTDHTVVVFNLPSYFFVSWYFDIPRHHYYYPNFSNIYIRHYELHPRSYFASTTYVGTWVNRHRYVYDRTWLVDDGRRVDRIREYGRLEDNYRRYVARRPDGSRVMDRSTYLNNKARSYPALEQSRRPDGTVSRRPSTDYDPVYQRRTTDRSDTKRQPENTERTRPRIPDYEPERRPSQENPSQRAPVIRRPTSQSDRSRETSQPSEYHREKWVRPTQRSSPTRTTPRPPGTSPKSTQSPSPRKPSRRPD